MSSGARRLARPIIVLGAPRSGTTLLAELLGAHPACARAREARLVWRYGNDHRSDELQPDDARPEVIAHIHDRFARLVEDGARLVEKTPGNAVRPWFVDAVFPDASYVHITRNGWAGAAAIRDFWVNRATGLDAKQRSKARRRLREASLRQLPSYAGEMARRVTGGRRHTPLYGPRIAGLQEVVDEHGHLYASALQWRTCVERSTSFGRTIGGDRYCEVKLEELDERTLGTLLSFCGLDASDAVVGMFRQRYDRSVATRKVELTDSERSLIAPLVEATNAWIGYPYGGG